MSTTKNAPKAKVPKLSLAAANAEARAAAGMPKRAAKKSGAQRRREAKERDGEAIAARHEAALDANDAIVAHATAAVEKKNGKPKTVLPKVAKVLARKAAAKQAAIAAPADDLDAEVAPEPKAEPTAVPAIITPDAIAAAAAKATEEKAARKARTKKEPKPPREKKLYHPAIRSLSNLTQRLINWRAKESVKAGRAGSFEQAITGYLVNLTPAALDKYAGGFRENDGPGRIVEAPSVKEFLATLDPETRAQVARKPRERKARVSRRASMIADARSTTATEVIGCMIEALGLRRAHARIASMLDCAKAKHPDLVPAYEAALDRLSHEVKAEDAAIAEAEAIEARKAKAAQV